MNNTNTIIVIHCSGKKKKREQTLARLFTETKQCCELFHHRNRTNIVTIVSHVFWLFVMFAESQIKASKRDPEYCKNGFETLFLGNP